MLNQKNGDFRRGTKKKKKLSNRSGITAQSKEKRIEKYDRK